MELLDRQVEPTQAIVQVVQEDGTWLDFATIKDAADCRAAERHIDDPQFRIIMRDWWDGVMQWIEYRGGAWSPMERN